MDDPQSMVAKPALGQGGVDFASVANQVEGSNSLVGLECAFGAFDDHSATVVATHHIHCNSHNRTGRGETRFRALEPSGSCCHCDDLAPFIIAAGGANPVWHVRGRALRTRTKLRQSQHAVIRAAHALTAS